MGHTFLYRRVSFPKVLCILTSKYTTQMQPDRNTIIESLKTEWGILLTASVWNWLVGCVEIICVVLFCFQLALDSTLLVPFAADVGREYGFALDCFGFAALLLCSAEICK